ncbi:hypothetical protein BgiMline_019272 [Biomphalaria glabrata]|nr:hypothetical protein BgiMline_032143 [Biomphalaria glabrata]
MRSNSAPSRLLYSPVTGAYSTPREGACKPSQMVAYNFQSQIQGAPFLRLGKPLDLMNSVVQRWNFRPIPQTLTWVPLSPRGKFIARATRKHSLEFKEGEEKKPRNRRGSRERGGA